MPRATGGTGRLFEGPEFWLRLLAVVLLIPAVSACPKKCEISELEVVPGKVMVGSDPAAPTTFRLEARLWSGPASNRVGLSIAQYPECKLTWKRTESWLHLDPTGDYLATVTIDPGASPSTPAFVTAKAGGLTSPGAEIRVVPATVTDQDMVRADYLAGSAPSAVVVNGTVGSPPEPWVAAFVRRAVVGKENASPDNAGWAAAVLDPAHGTAMYPGPWTPGQDQIGAPPPAAVRSIPVALRIAVDATYNQDAVKNAALVDIGAANAVLAESRVGVALGPVTIKTIPPSEVGSDFADCVKGDNLTPIGDQPGMLHLFYLSKLGTLTGLTCPATDARPQSVIYIAYDNYNTVTLIHEVGHALGLVVPSRGHVENSPGFDASNVMSSANWDADPFGRHRFTVGQAFRMNADSASWLNWVTDATGTPLLRAQSVPLMGCQCGSADPAGRCPRLSDDVARRRGGLGDAQAWGCEDRLKLPDLDTGEKAAALIAGRRWRDRPGHCSLGLPGSQIGGGRILRFANLTRPGKCPSWAALFFSGHSPVFLKLGEPEMVWTDVSELLEVSADTPLPQRTPVTAAVYYPVSEAGPANDQIKAAQWVFGDGNLTGLALTIVPHSGPCGTGSGDEVSICYSATAGATVAQLLGKAFGLSLLTVDEENDPAFLHNVMQRTASMRGDRLTLGQLFRIHSTLGPPGGFPDCSLTPELCPPITADASP